MNNVYSMMYYSAHWEIRQMIFWTSSLCLYTNSSTFSTATEKKKEFRSSRFKSLVEKKKKNVKRLVVVTHDVWPCAGVKNTGAVITHGHFKCAHEKRKVKKK